jgi:hypothetical protein
MINIKDKVIIRDINDNYNNIEQDKKLYKRKNKSENKIKNTKLKIKNNLKNEKTKNNKS